MRLSHRYKPSTIKDTKGHFGKKLMVCILTINMVPTKRTETPIPEQLQQPQFRSSLVVTSQITSKNQEYRIRSLVILHPGLQQRLWQYLAIWESR